MGCHKAFVFLGVPGCAPPVDCSAGEQCGQDTQGDTWDPPEGDTCRQDTQGYTWDPPEGDPSGQDAQGDMWDPQDGISLWDYILW